MIKLIKKIIDNIEFSGQIIKYNNRNIYFTYYNGLNIQWLKISKSEADKLLRENKNE